MLLAAAILTSLNFIEDGQAGEAAGNALEQLLLAERDARAAARRAGQAAKAGACPGPPLLLFIVKGRRAFGKRRKPHLQKYEARHKKRGRAAENMV